MNWKIERDESGMPIRMMWMGSVAPVSKHNQEFDKMIWRNSLPMRSMRKWAEQRGLISTNQFHE